MKGLSALPHQWRSDLEEFKCTLSQISNKLQGHMDALSCHPQPPDSIYLIQMYQDMVDELAKWLGKYKKKSP